MRWHDGQWHQVTGLPATLRSALFGSVLARSDRNVWLGSAAPNHKGGSTGAVGHWNGRRWTVTRLQAPAITGHYHVISIVPDGSGGLWALGYCEHVGPRASWCPTQGSRALARIRRSVDRAIPTRPGQAGHPDVRPRHRREVGLGRRIDRHQHLERPDRPLGTSPALTRPHDRALPPTAA